MGTDDMLALVCPACGHAAVYHKWQSRACRGYMEPGGQCWCPLTIDQIRAEVALKALGE